MPLSSRLMQMKEQTKVYFKLWVKPFISFSQVVLKEMADCGREETDLVSNKLI